MQIERKQIAGLDTLTVSGEPEGLTLVLFHGYGANSADLAPLAGEINAPPGTTYIFPEGPLDLGGPSRAWWHIDHAALEQAMALGKTRDLTGPAPAGLPPARERALALVAELNVPMQRLVLGGFSQGAMLSTHLTLALPQKPAGLIALSGNLVDREAVRTAAPLHAGLPYFQSHGTADPILGFEHARAQYELLTESGWQSEFFEFNGGHEIPRGAIEGTERLLAQITNDD